MARPEESAVSTSWNLSKTLEGDTGWLIGLSAILLLALQPFSSYVASLPLIQAEWAMSNTQAGLVFSSYLVGSAVSSLLLVPLTDRISPRRVLILGITMLTLSNLLFPLLAWNAWLGMLWRFLAGAGHIAAYIPGIQLVSARFSGRKRGMAVGVFVGAGYAGTTFSYIFMGALLNYTSSWRIAYFITALVGLIGVALAFRLTRSAGPTSGSGAAEKEQRPGARGVWGLNLGVLRDRAAALVIIAYALHTAELYLARLWFPLLLGVALSQNELSSLEATALAATLSGFMFMTGIAGVFIGGAFSDHVGRSAGAALIFGLSGLCSFLAGWLLGWPPAILIGLGFIYGFSTAADSAIYSTAVTELSPAGQIGSTQAVQSFIGFTIGAMMPVVAGSILDMTGSGWGWAFSFNGLLAAVGVAALLWLRRLPQAGRMAGGKK